MPVTASQSVANPLAHWRTEFAVFERAIYLNTCSLGPLARRTRERITTFLDQWDERGAANWYDIWWSALDELRLRYGAVVNARPGEIALRPSISSILGVIGSGLDTTRRRRIVTTAIDFPTLPYQWLPRDAEVVLLESPDGVTVPVEAFDRAVNRDTALVATSHVYYASGAIQDVCAIGQIARRAGALTLIDGYQAAGQIPVDVQALDVDFYLAGGLKWLLGGTGITFLYARSDSTADVIPCASGWFAHRDQFAFDPSTFVPHIDARRFETGTPALPSVHAQLGGLDVIESAGVGAIREVTSALTEDLVIEAQSHGLRPRIAATAAERSAIVMLPRPDPRADVARLAAAGFVVDSRPGHVRVSPCFYNVADDHRALLEVLLDA
ncbi:MAG TPA: aminotransferase class V-fold PLP-dependent enzyme [Gemmatimonadales bacterium]|jgi:selenocysteine lyase/cysteine desulfurase